jgi:hypothetical protein
MVVSHDVYSKNNLVTVFTRTELRTRVANPVCKQLPKENIASFTACLPSSHKLHTEHSLLFNIKGHKGRVKLPDDFHHMVQGILTNKCWYNT